MIIAKKIRIKPTKEQEVIFWKSAGVKKLKKKLKREQRKLSRKYQANIEKYDNKRKPIYKKPLKEMRNIQKQIRLIQRINRKLNNIRNNHLHQSSSDVVKAKPYRIVMETLNVKGMMRNRHLAKAIQEQKLYEFKRQVHYKSALYGIEFVEADRWYPSSRKCSRCGTIKTDLKLKDRLYSCVCGLRMDRDLNASINLANYKV